MINSAGYGVGDCYNCGLRIVDYQGEVNPQSAIDNPQWGWAVQDSNL